MIVVVTRPPVQTARGPVPYPEAVVASQVHAAIHLEALLKYDPAPATNAPLVRATLAHIEADPDGWSQLGWNRRTDCGTTACFAGTAHLLATGRPMVDADDNAMQIVEVVRHLGFTADQAARIFYFMSVIDAETEQPREPNFAELCAQVAAVTGIVYTPGGQLALTAAPVLPPQQGLVEAAITRHYQEMVSQVELGERRELVGAS